MRHLTYEKVWEVVNPLAFYRLYRDVYREHACSVVLFLFNFVLG